MKCYNGSTTAQRVYEYFEYFATNDVYTKYSLYTDARSTTFLNDLYQRTYEVAMSGNICGTGLLTTTAENSNDELVPRMGIFIRKLGNFPRCSTESFHRTAGNFVTTQYTLWYDHQLL